MGSTGSVGAGAVPAPAPDVLTAPEAARAPAVEAQQAWIDGYEPGNPWQARLCLRTPQGTVAYPLTPHTMPELLEGLVLVAQEQQGMTGALPGDDGPGAVPVVDGEAPEPDQGGRLHDGRTARLTGWAVVHDLWEREDPTARLIMGAIVVALLLLGIVLS
ncbi:hypothetical protein NX801_04950 [Streptomyces sp. LP05-1]|uniref:Integral membrane protein n=1 Tax=Streptomyces pyxinae TaxID=2970734 RepID=A0ABT2CCA3_9ACTN|nr:hypothetical protein [Streptomyces sp. LP05-1]MCS0635015.1 hypothetical protein [Streptomyces sp. LP05-1]